jgi:murein L,D-transpeptidase YcbB/YkuD
LTSRVLADILYLLFERSYFMEQGDIEFFEAAMNFKMRKHQLQMWFGSLVVALSPAFFSLTMANAETGVTLGNVHIEPAFGAPTKPNSGAAVTATEVVADQAQLPMLTERSSTAMQSAEARYQSIISRGGFPSVPRGTYKKGAKGPAIIILNQRLFMEGYLRVEGTQGEFAALFTSATQDSVSRYQRNMGLAVTGKVDAATLAELNIPAAERLATIRANIPRLELYEQGLGGRYLVVNIPAQQIETVSDGHVFSRHNAIVGRPERPTPVVMTPLSEVKFNPYWNAPVSIVERDIIPKLKSGTQILNDMEIKVFKGVGGPEVDPSTVDWSTAVADDYAFRQEPGPHNAMATAKIEFNSPFGIYLHDTSEPGLFKTANRFYSSGCVRVDKMPLLVEWVLDGQDGFGEAKISTMAETLERLDVPLVSPPELRVAYLTAWPASKNTVAFRRDVYDLDGSGFTVGQPMPVGEMSPDGQRFVLKPLPRQIPIDAAEGDGVGLFHFGKSKGKLFGSTTPKKSLFGKPLMTPDSAPATKQGKTLATISTTTAKAGKDKKFSGLFDWEAYRKQQKLGMSAKPSKKTSKVDKKTKSKKTAKSPSVQDASISLNDIPPEPTLDIPVKPTVKKTDAKAAKCVAGVDGKTPANCKPKT